MINKADGYHRTLDDCYIRREPSPNVDGGWRRSLSESRIGRIGQSGYFTAAKVPFKVNLKILNKKIKPITYQHGSLQEMIADFFKHTLRRPISGDVGSVGSSL